MAYRVRVSLPTYNALTDNDPRHYSVFADSDNVLIKEKTRGSASIANGATQNIAHGLSYIPFVLVYAEVTAGRWSQTVGQSGDYNAEIRLDTTNLKIFNGLGSTKTFKYYIFYDDQVS